MSHEVGGILDRRYALKRVVARSDGSVLFEASHVHLERTVAVRVLTGAALTDGRARAALFREARLLDRVRHGSVIEVLDVAETENGEPYLVTAPLVGRFLDGVLSARGSLPVDEAVAITLSIGSALAHAHTLDIAHAGLAPSSVLLAYTAAGSMRATMTRREGSIPSAMLVDFGVAPGPSNVLSGALGAMGYAAPERLAGAPPDPATDAYALGALLHEMIAGELPGDASLADVIPAVPEDVVEIVHRALAPRHARFESVAAMVDTLREASLRRPLPSSGATPARRAHERASYVTPVRLRRANGEALDGRCEDISEGGLLLLVDGELAVDEELLVRFALPVSGRIVSEPARARWSRRTRGAFAVGVELLSPSEKVREDIRAYVAYLGAGA